MALTSSPPAIEPPPFRTREGSLLYRYYADLQRETGALVPGRKAIDPQGARAFLPYVMIMEPIDPDTIMLRLAGTAVINRIGQTLTGTNIFNWLPPDERATMWRNCRHVLATPCGCRLRHRESFSNKAIDTEVVMFPLADQDGKPRFTISTSVQVNLQELAGRGQATETMGGVEEIEYLDIGAGTAT